MRKKASVFSSVFQEIQKVLKNGKKMYTDEVRKRRRGKTKSFKSGK